MGQSHYWQVANRENQWALIHCFPKSLAEAVEQHSKTHKYLWVEPIEKLHARFSYSDKLERCRKKLWDLIYQDSGRLMRRKFRLKEVYGGVVNAKAWQYWMSRPHFCLYLVRPTESIQSMMEYALKQAAQYYASYYSQLLREEKPASKQDHLIAKQLCEFYWKMMKSDRKEVDGRQGSTAEGRLKEEGAGTAQEADEQSDYGDLFSDEGSEEVEESS